MIKDALETLGTKIDANQERDAVHIAVLPVEASEILCAGEHVGISDGKATAECREDLLIGIVDPFLKEGVAPGQYFWLMLYPRTITSLRHVWEHPGITDTQKERSSSEQWLRDFVSQSDCPSYETVIAEALDRRNEWDDEYLHFSGLDAHGDIPAEFWDHVEAVSGQRITSRPKYFSCSC